jgi:hypothetical protein
MSRAFEFIADAVGVACIFALLALFMAVTI